MATVEDGRRYFPIGGNLKSLPPDTELWVFVKDISQPRWWPHGPAAVTDGTWNISRLYCGWGQEVKLQACVVGKSGQALVHYYRLAWRQMDQLKRDIKKEFPSANIDGFQASAIAELSTDITSFDDKTVTVI